MMSRLPGSPPAIPPDAPAPPLRGRPVAGAARGAGIPASRTVRPVRPPAATRGSVRRFLEARGTLGGHRSPHTRRGLRTTDGVWLSAAWLPGPARSRPTADVPAVVVLHGFAASAGKPAYARLADTLQHDATVLAVDLRGHGRSGGWSTLGDRERHDVAAAVAALRGDGHRHVTLVGVSMGATSAVHAVATDTAVDALVLVSGPGYLPDEPRTAPLRQLHRHWHSPFSRAVMRWGLRVRVSPPASWSRPRHPADIVPDDLPTLVVHGHDDAYFPVDDARALAAGPRAVLWLEDGFGHAEDGLTPAWCGQLRRALAVQVRTGGFEAVARPDRSVAVVPDDRGPSSREGR